MIGSLRGTLMSKQAPQIIIECQGVGYEVETPMSTFLDLPSIGDELFLHTHLLVREDAQILYGFGSLEERSLFRMLLRISGVGAKMGLAILSTMSVADFQRCVEYEDAATLVKIPGVGKKTAERLIIEMRDKVDALMSDSASPSLAVSNHSAASEAVEALQALGYRAVDAEKMISRAQQQGEAAGSASQLIKLALQASVKR